MATSKPVASDDLYTLIKDCLPDDHARQVAAPYYIQQVCATALGRPRVVLDLGCGDGRSVDLFRKHEPACVWHGLDIEVSPEVATRTRADATFHSYDGVHIPFPDGSVDVVYSNQVFEHVRHPDAVMAEIARVLRPGGAFIASVSTLEPYHSFSFWCFTPWGWYTLLRDAGLTPREFRPGIDGIALVQRSYQGRPKHARAWFDSSPLNEEMDKWGKATGRRAALVNLRKVQYCGHLVSLSTKPDVTP